MGLIQRIRPHRAAPEAAPDAAPDAAPEAASGAVPSPAPPAAAESAVQHGAAAVLHRLRGTCPHCHKPQQVESPTTWVTTPCSYCSAPVTLHA